MKENRKMLLLAVIVDFIVEEERHIQNVMGDVQLWLYIIDVPVHLDNTVCRL